MLINILLFAIALLVCFYLLLRWHEQRCASKLVSTETKQPIQNIQSIFGVIRAQMLPSGVPIHQDLYNRAIQHNFQPYLSFVAHIPIIIVSDAASIKQVFLNPKMFRKADFSSFLPPIVAKFLGQSVFSTNGDQWKGQRVIMNPAFADVSGFTDIFTQKTIKALDRLKTKDTNAIPIDKMLVKLTLDILGQTIFDYDFKLLDSEDINDKYVKAYHYIIKHMNDPIRVLGGKLYEKLPLQANKDIYEANDTLDELVHNVAEKARKEYDPDVAPRSLLEMILRTRDTETGHVFTEQELRDNMIIFFIAGHETTSTALTFALYSLGKNKHVQEKLVQEVETAFCNDFKNLDQVLNYEQVNNLEYMHLFLKENLRMYPPVPILPGRQVSQAETVGKFKVPKDHIVTCNLYSLMHNPEIWGDPEVFRPERFSEEESKNRPSMVHVPFGAGPRTCIGSKFSILEQCVFLIELLRRYTVVLVDPNYEMKYKKNTILLAVEDFKITLVPRK